MWKKTIAFLISAGMVLSLGACSGTEPGNDSAGQRIEAGGAVEDNDGMTGESGENNTEWETETGNSQENLTGEEGGLRQLVSENMEGCLTENGYYYLTTEMEELSDGNFGTHLMYMDFAAQQEIYLCSNAGCTHNSQDCPSVFPCDDFPLYTTILFVWKDSLYVLSKKSDDDGSSIQFFGERIGDSDYMEERSAVLYKMNLDGTGRERFYVFDASLTLEDLVLCDETGLYVVTKKLSAQEEEEGTFINSAERRLVYLDPESKEIKDICNLEFGDSISWHLADCYGRTLVLEGIDYKREVSNEELYDDDAYKDIFDNSEEIVATLSIDNGSPVVRYRMSNQALNSSVIDRNMLYVSSEADGVVRSVDLITGQEKELYRAQEGACYLYQKIGDKLCCEEKLEGHEFSYIDVDTGEICRSSLVNKSLGWRLEFRGVLDSDVLVIYDYEATPLYGESYEIIRYQFGLISQEDLFAGNDNFRRINMIGKGR